MSLLTAFCTVILFLHVFSDYKGGDDISLHPAPLLSCCMSFLTTKEGMTFRCIRHRDSLLACLFWLHRRRWHFVASGTNTIQGILLGFHMMYPMMCTVHHVGSTWHKTCVCWVHSSWLSCLARSSRQPKKFEVTSEELDDWEFVLCLMSILEPVAFLPRPSECHPLFKFN